MWSSTLHPSPGAAQQLAAGRLGRGVVHFRICGKAGISVQSGLDYRKMVEPTSQLLPGQVVIRLKCWRAWRTCLGFAGELELQRDVFEYYNPPMSLSLLPSRKR
ncbi:hypothetical protein MVEN_02298900 [Mycena venus]|uniref:Uncharacterized protein n=1 Tax=Mycena venus TaxID=2733690 RepID=A0A8H6X565_9AGAR|nr:hypothetical protein MVEN_02298900 [Mycena venus]